LLAEHQHAAAQHGVAHTTVEIPDERHHLHALPPKEPDLRLGHIDGELVLPLMTTVELDMREPLDAAGGEQVAPVHVASSGGQGALHGA
jgi:hypothetical protein